MRLTLSRFALAAGMVAACSLAALAQSSFAIEPGRAYACNFTRSELRMNGKVMTKSNEKFVGTSGIITSKIAYYCTRTTCYHYDWNAELSKTAQVYVDSDGWRLTTNALALELDGGITLESEIRAVKTVNTLSGTCKEMSKSDLTKALNKFRNSRRRR
jgi:hypothetical protein